MTSQRFADLQQNLDDFRASHHPQRLTVGRHEWEYFRCGAGPETMLVLPGGLARAETAFRYVRHFAERYQVITISYPPSAATMWGYARGLAGLLGQLGVERAHVVGGSYSGLVAQCLVRVAPERVAGLVLSDTGVPRRARAALGRALLPLIAHLPLGSLRRLMALSLVLPLRRMDAHGDFWRRYFAERVSIITREECLGQLRSWIDFDRAAAFTPADLDGWGGRILIIEAEHDGIFGPAEQRCLRALYPQARAHTFADSPHCASLSRIDDYLELIDQFLKEIAPCPEPAV